MAQKVSVIEGRKSPPDLRIPAGRTEGIVLVLVSQGRHAGTAVVGAFGSDVPLESFADLHHCLRQPVGCVLLFVSLRHWVAQARPSTSLCSAPRS